MAFIVFEGIDGAGKSSLIKALSEALCQRDIDFEISREPGGTALGNELRNILIRTEAPHPLKPTELLLYMADRAQHVAEKILPSLKAGRWFISDRYTASTLAFQAGGRELSDEDINWLNHFATQGLQPELFVLLDLSINESSQRIQKRSNEQGQEKDRFELENQSFHQRVRSKYLEIAKQDPDRWLILNASKSPEDLKIDLLDFIDKRSLW